MTDRPLPNGWRLSVPYETSKQSAYVKGVVEELSAIPRMKRQVPNTWNGKPIEELTQEEREEFHFSQQSESTKAAILRQRERKPHEDIDYLLRPMPECVANPQASNLNELVGNRELTVDEILAHHNAKLSRRNTIGQGDKSSVDADKRQKGIEAFTYSKPAELSEEQLKKLTKMEEIVNTPLNSEKPKKGFFSWLMGKHYHDDWHWVDDGKGGKRKVQHGDK